MAYPVLFSSKDKAEIEADVQAAERGMEAMEMVQKCFISGIAFHQYGRVDTEFYDLALEAMGKVRDKVISKYAMTEQEREECVRVWPFDTKEASTADVDVEAETQKDATMGA